MFGHIGSTYNQLLEFEGLNTCVHKYALGGNGNPIPPRRLSSVATLVYGEVERGCVPPTQLVWWERAIGYDEYMARKGWLGKAVANSYKSLREGLYATISFQKACRR